ncbi:hypothetical protein AB4212_46615, partial [Streptomyces sp. 2MCAF27]
MKLVQLAEAFDLEGVLRELAALTPEERAAQADALEAQREKLRDEWHSRRSEEEQAAQLAAELGCRTDPAAAVDWFLRPENWDLPLGGAWMLEVLNLHPVAWRTELFALLTEQAEFRCSWAVDFIEHLALDTGRAVPT